MTVGEDDTLAFALAALGHLHAFPAAASACGLSSVQRSSWNTGHQEPGIHTHGYLPLAGLADAVPRQRHDDLFTNIGLLQRDLIRHDRVLASPGPRSPAGWVKPMWWATRKAAHTAKHGLEQVIIIGRAAAPRWSVWAVLVICSALWMSVQIGFESCNLPRLDP